MSYGSIPGSSDLQYRLQSTQITIDGKVRIASSLISEFLNNTDDEIAWNNMNTVILKFLTTYSQLLTGLRVLITLSDGTVAYDSSKGIKNNFDNYQLKGLGENHNTRVAIMVALLGNSGVGNEQKYSTTTGKNENYTAVRMGLSTAKPLGCTRVSLDTIN
jgi:hypothetical protein